MHAPIVGHLERDAQTSDAVASWDATSLCRVLGEPGLDHDRVSYANCVRHIFMGNSTTTH